MHGEFSAVGTYFLLASALLFGLTMVAIGRRVPAPASGAAYGTAVAALVAYPLLAQGYAVALDRAVDIAGFGLFLDHTAFMVQMGGLLLTFVLATDQWAQAPPARPRRVGSPPGRLHPLLAGGPHAPRA